MNGSSEIRVRQAAERLKNPIDILRRVSLAKSRVSVYPIERGEHVDSRSENTAVGIDGRGPSRGDMRRRPVDGPTQQSAVSTSGGRDVLRRL